MVHPGFAVAHPIHPSIASTHIPPGPTEQVLKSDQRLRSELITLLAPSGHKAATVRKGLLDSMCTPCLYTWACLLSRDPLCADKRIDTNTLPHHNLSPTTHLHTTTEQYFVVGTGSDPVVKLVLKGVKTVGRRVRGA